MHANTWGIRKHEAIDYQTRPPSIATWSTSDAHTFTGWILWLVLWNLFIITIIKGIHIVWDQTLWVMTLELFLSLPIVPKSHQKCLPSLHQSISHYKLRVMILLLADFLFVYLFPKYTTDGPYAIKKKLDQIS